MLGRFMFYNKDIKYNKFNRSQKLNEDGDPDE